MNAEEIEREMEARRAGKPAPAPPRPRPPLEELLTGALDLARSAPEVQELDERRQEAERVRDRLPSFLRHVKSADLELRVRDARLLRSFFWLPGGRSTLLLGPTGVGKSSAAALGFRRLLVAGWRDGGKAWDFARGLRWFSASALSQARREHPLGMGPAPELVRAEHASLLVIDDAGWDRDTNAVSDVLNARYERERPTVITSGRTLDEITAHYGAAVIRRLTEAGGGRSAVVDCFPMTPSAAGAAE